MLEKWRKFHQYLERVIMAGVENPVITMKELLDLPF